MTAPFLTRKARDVRDAIVTLPSPAAWRRCAALYGAFLLLGLPLGLASGLLHPSSSGLPAGAAVGSALTVALYPAFSEELLFRVLLLPRRLERSARGLAIVAAALVVYVAAHPLNAMVFQPGLLGLFSNPYYLTLTTLLGLTCSAAYLTSGSIWPAVFMHWLTVVLWIFGLGGQALIERALGR